MLWRALTPERIEVSQIVTLSAHSDRETDERDAHEDDRNRGHGAPPYTVLQQRDQPGARQELAPHAP